MSWVGWWVMCGTLLSVPGLSGVDAPIVKVSRPLEPSDSSPSGQAKEECQVYSGFAVVSRIDPGVMGASMVVRPATEGTAAKALCAPGLKKVAIPLRVEAGYFWGASGRYILVHSADDFGVLRGLTVYDSQDGRQILDTEINAGQGVKVTTIKKAEPAQIELRFNRRLTVSCMMGVGAPPDACWKEIRGKNGIPDGVVLPPPKCPAVSTDATDPNATLQVTAPAKAVLGPDLGEAHVDFLPGKATCSLTP